MAAGVWRHSKNGRLSNPESLHPRYISPHHSDLQQHSYLLTTFTSSYLPFSLHKCISVTALSFLDRRALRILPIHVKQHRVLIRQILWRIPAQPSPSLPRPPGLQSHTRLSDAIPSPAHLSPSITSTPLANTSTLTLAGHG